LQFFRNRQKKCNFCKNGAKQRAFWRGLTENVIKVTKFLKHQKTDLKKCIFKLLTGASKTHRFIKIYFAQTSFIPHSRTMIFAALVGACKSKTKRNKICQKYMKKIARNLEKSFRLVYNK